MTERKQIYSDMFLMIIARCTMRDRCHQNDRQHIIGNIFTAIHVCCNGRANVQGRGQHFTPQSLVPSRKFSLYRFCRTTCVAIYLQWKHPSLCHIKKKTFQLHLWVYTFSILTASFTLLSLISHGLLFYIYLIFGLENILF